MTEVSARRIQQKLDTLWKHLADAGAVGDYDGIIAAIRPTFQDPTTSPAAWIHQMARSHVTELFPNRVAESIQPEQFYAILGLIDSREKAYNILLTLPEEAVTDVERLLGFMLKELLPSIRTQAQATVDALPYKRSGGPKTSSMPEFSVCREISVTIEMLHSKQGVGKVIAQQQMADKYDLSLRTVQRIWHDREKYLT